MLYLAERSDFSSFFASHSEERPFRSLAGSLDAPALIQVGADQMSGQDAGQDAHSPKSASMVAARRNPASVDSDLSLLPRDELQFLCIKYGPDCKLYSR